MKLKVSILIIFSSFLGFGQNTNSMRIPSSWIGEIKMGDTTPELVFNIFKDSLGNAAANLGVPSKGIQDIPFDKVEIKRDSIFLEISTAQASYKGAFNINLINGIWAEGPNTFSLTLRPLNKELDYTNSKRKNTSSLDLGFKSKNFNFYSKKSDTSVLENMSKILEANCIRITKDLKTNFESKIDVFIYPDLKSFHTAINYPDAPDWVVGAAGKNELKMVSPLNPGSVHSYESLMKAIVHELAHTIVLNLRKQGLVGIPNWLNEGYAYYQAKQITEAERKRIHTNLLNNKIPSWNELEKSNTSEFGDIGGYGISATIIEFLIESYGPEKLKQYIIEPKNVEKIYLISRKDLEVMWLKYLKAVGN